MAKLSKNRDGLAIGFDAVSFQDFDTVPTAGPGIASTTVQSRLAMPCRFKILKIALNYSGIGTGAHAFNIVVGTGVSNGAPLTKDQIAVAGNAVFAVDKALSGSADTNQIFLPDNPDMIYDTGLIGAAGALLTLRVATAGTTGSFTNLKCNMLICVEDPLRTKGGATPGVDY